MHNGRLIYAGAAIGLGLVGLVFGDFARQWQPVPEGVPARTFLVYLSAVVMGVAGIATLFRGSARAGAWVLAGSYALWTFVLHGPRVVATPLQVVPWLGFAEIMALTAAGALLAMTRDGAVSTPARRTACLVFGACPLVFGVSHFAYAEYTANMVPAWMPWRLFWAYATGVAHVAAGLAILTGMLARPAAHLLALMMGLFTLMVHVPRVFAEPASHHEWTMLCIASALTGAAWIVAAALPGVRRAPLSSGVGRPVRAG